MPTEPKTGTVARIRAGHDKHSLCAVTKIGNGFVYVADGRTRKIGKPKKKNPKHLEFSAAVLNVGEMTDKALRKALAEF